MEILVNLISGVEKVRTHHRHLCVELVSAKPKDTYERN